MVYFYNGNNGNNYVTLALPNSDPNSEHVVKRKSICERLVTVTRCRGEVVTLKVVTVLLIIAVVSLSYTSHMHSKKLERVRLMIEREILTIAGRAMNTDPRCIFAIGNAVGASYFHMGNQNSKECIEVCMDIKRTTDSTINGVTLYSTKTNKPGCWCESKMTGINSNKKYKTCFLMSLKPSTGTNKDSRCTFSIGNAVGTGSFNMGRQETNSCVDACMDLRAIDATLNGVTLYSNSKQRGCWCGRNVTTTDTNGRYKTCSLKLNKTQRLDLNVDSRCTFLIGNAVGALDLNIASDNESRCIDTCLHLKGIDETVNGVTLYTDTMKRGCWCEKSMKRTNYDVRYKTCFLKNTNIEKPTGFYDNMTCKFSFGNAVASSYFKVGLQDGSACINACRHMKEIDTSINGVTLAIGERSCWCERNMTGTVTSKKYKTCLLEVGPTARSPTGVQDKLNQKP